MATLIQRGDRQTLPFRIGPWLPLTMLLGLCASVVHAGDPDNCLLCHQYRGLSRFDPDTSKVRLYSVNPNYTHSLLGPHARLRCTDCHVRSQVSVIPHAALTPVDCARQCHLRDVGGRERLFSHANVAEMLERSSHGKDALSQLEFTGGPLLNEGQSACLYCHDEPVFRDPGRGLPVIRELSGHTLDRCDVCHTEQLPVDIAYYLRHIAARLQPARSALELAQVCAVCHSDPKVMEAHDMKDAVASFVRSFHGKAALLGDESTADCLSCHTSPGENAHLMLSRDDPASSVYPARVANSCRSAACHPGADASFEAASVHLDLPTSYASLECLVATAFILLTILTFAPSAIIVVLELFQVVVGRRRPGEERAKQLTRMLEEHPRGRRRLRRFTVSQRIQHWILAILFTVLAVTGFPMKFADREWARITIDAFGSLHAARMIHHWSGIALVFGLATHMVYVLWTLYLRVRSGRRAGTPRGFIKAVFSLPMWIGISDLRKAGHLLLYLILLRPKPPTFGRFSIKEKFEYVGVFWGTILLGATGVMLWGEQISSHLLGGRWFNIASIAHTYEAFLAIIHVGVLHICNVVLAPNVFPLSRATLSGRTPLLEMAEGHSEFVDEAARDLELGPPPGDTHE